MRSLVIVVLWIAILGLVGCTSSSESETTRYEAALRQANSCEDVLDAIHADEIAKVDLELEQFIDQDPYWRFGGPVFEDAAGGDSPNGPPAPSTPTRGDGDAPDGFSDTNRQVADVDEADIVKVGDEGRKLYVIRGNGFYEFDSWPAEETVKVADVDIEGAPLEMFVHGERAVVFSSVHSVEGLDDGDSCRDHWGGGAPEPGFADEDIAYYCGRPYVKLTVIDVGGESNDVVRELYVDGWYTSSRRHDDIVRVVTQSNMQRPSSIPHLYDVVYDGQTDPSREEATERARTWATLAKNAIRTTTLEQWLPSWGERVDGEVVELPFQCSNFYSPTPGLTNYGLSQVLGLDVNDAQKTALTSILGQASHVYANSEALVLAQPDYAWYERDRNFDRTALHRFVVSDEGERTPYEGSGFVEGVVHDQFSIDERDGIIRVATTRTTFTDRELGGMAPDVWIPPVTHNLLSTLRLEDGQLDVLGKSPDLAEDERIFSVRFVGDIGYMVTFRQVDPLFAIDLSDPSNPTVLGELKIPGFSDYMHPLGPDHLLTIGRDVDEDTQIDRGTALQIFDVSDPVNPSLAHKALVGDGFSLANHDHKAFNFYARDSATVGILAFPFVTYERGFSSTLELWNVSAEEGFNARGAVDHSDLLVADCGGGVPFDDFYGYCGYAPEIMRGVFIDEYIYSISHAGVRVHTVADLAHIATATY